MSRSLSATTSGAIIQNATRPIYLIEMNFSTPIWVATWDSAISWNSLTWQASGVYVKGLNARGTDLVLPTGASDPWLALVLNEGVRDRAVSIYEHHTDTTVSPHASDATLVFTGKMDVATITDQINVSVLESSQAKAFPALSVDQPVFTYLLTSGDVISWGNTEITVN